MQPLAPVIKIRMVLALVKLSGKAVRSLHKKAQVRDCPGPMVISAAPQIVRYRLRSTS